MQSMTRNVPFVRTAVSSLSKPSGVELEVVDLFDQFRDPLLRYALSLGLPIHDAEDIVQEVFLAMFRHLLVGRPRNSLRGWLFKVTHNLALKQREAVQSTRRRTVSDANIAEQQIDLAPTPEECISCSERRQRLLAVVRALPENEQSCLRLRAEGLRYREIASILGISLGAVSISLTRSLARLIRADGR